MHLVVPPSPRSALLILLTMLALTACSAGVESRFPTAPQSPNDAPVQVKGLLAKPEGIGPFPAVVLLHSCGGMAYHVRHLWPDTLVASGYVVLSVDSFGPRGIGPCPNAIMSQSDAHLAWMTGDAYGALDYLATLSYVDANRVAVMGFSLGAFVINLDMTPRNGRSPGGRQFKAAVAFYGMCASPRFGPGLTALADPPYPLLEMIPALDAPAVSSCGPLTRPWIEKHVLVGAHHGFDFQEAANLGRGPMGGITLYNRVATEQSQEIVRDYLARTLK